jgi:hypothetical protein
MRAASLDVGADLVERVANLEAAIVVLRARLDARRVAPPPAAKIAYPSPSSLTPLRVMPKREQI